MNSMWLYEIRRCGPSVLATPIAVAAAAGLVSPALGVDTTIQVIAGNTVALVAGLAAAAALGGEQMVELQLTVRTPYSLTVARRLALVLAATSCAVLLFSALASSAANAWTGTLLVGNTAFALALIGVATYMAAGHGSTAGASTMVVTVWLGKLLVLDNFVRAVPTQAAVLLTVAAPCVWLAVQRLMDSETQMHGAGG
ncbi:hypothetical protein [Nocardia sp. NPDC050175]|uniref:hypothetical protein n=1 Tax=Nocardia sp. NPDC050175 TaxID=3364317 RepID=UPI003798D2D5